MSKLKDFMRIVNERDRARIDVEALNRQLKDRAETLDKAMVFGEKYDEEFRRKFIQHLDELILTRPMWDYKRLMTNQEFAGVAMNQRRDFKFETNVPKIELEEEKDG